MSDKLAKFVKKVYKNRCILCSKKGSHVHEIIPKSQTKNWNRLENRVLLCMDCHDKVHRKGAMNWVETLTARKESFLFLRYGTNSEVELYRRLS